MSIVSITESIEFLKCIEIDEAHGVHPGLKKVMDEIMDLIKIGQIDKAQCSEFTESIIDCILFTRDIKTGRGLRTLAYSYLFTFQQYFPMKAIFILYMFVNSETTHQIGSWRDIREYCEFVAKHSQCGAADSIIKPIVGMYNNQMIKDNAKMAKHIATWNDKQQKISTRISETDAATAPPLECPPAEISFASKWTPRDRLKHRWLFTLLVKMWAYIDPECKDIIATAITDSEKEAVFDVCKKKYKAMVSRLAREVDR